MQRIAINITKDFKVKAFVIREFDEDDTLYSHRILYCQNKLIDYMVYPICKELNEDYKKLIVNQEDTLIGENNKEWVFCRIKILVPYCIIPELEK